MKNCLLLLLVTAFVYTSQAQMDASILKDIENVENKVIDWRHDFHQNPELSNREFNTAKKIAAHLKN